MELPGFQLLEKLGEGGMATIWKARQLSLDRIVAVKILSSRGGEPPDAVGFQREGQAMASLKHPGIVQVYDANVHEGVYYLIMEYVAGYSIGDWIRRKKVIPESDALLTAECIAEALNCAWSTQRMIHCDIKPDNVMIDADGTVKVADLGLATFIHAAGGRAESDEVMGTPNYMSPEQVAGVSDLDCRTDVYSLGAMLYHMTTGRMLFHETADARGIMDRQMTAQAPDPLDLNPELSMSTCWMIEKMLAKDRALRHPDWDAALADIRLAKRGELPEGSPLAEGASTVLRSPKRTRPRRRRGGVPFWKKTAGARRPAWPALAVAAFVLLASSAVLLWPRPAPRLPALQSAPDGAPAGTDGQETKAAGMHGLALMWASAHPDDYDGAIERFDRVLKEAKAAGDGRYTLAAAAKLASVRAAKAKAVTGAMAALEDETRRLLTAGDFEGALACCRNYQGPFALETAARRRELEGEALQKEQEAEQGKAAEGALAALENEVQRLLKENDFEGAIALCRDYHGAFAQETADRRKELESEALKKQQEFRAAQDQKRQQKERKFAALTEAVAVALLSSDVTKALEVLVAGRKDAQLQDVAALTAVEQLLGNAAAFDKKLLQSFTDQIGRTVTLALNEGPKTLTVLDVSSGKIRGEETVTKGTYTTSRKVELAFSDLSPAEVERRVGQEDKDVALLRKGLLAAHAAAYTVAEGCLGKLSPPLSAALLKGLSDLSTREANLAAEQALARLLADIGVTVPEKYDVGAWRAAIASASLAGETIPSLEARIEAYRKEHGQSGFARSAEPVLASIVPKAKADADKAVAAAMAQTDVHALKRALMNSNRNLEANEIDLRKSDLYPGFRLTIRSERLTTLGTFKTYGSAISELDVSGSKLKDLAPIAGTSIRSLDISDVKMPTFPMLRSSQLERLIMKNSTLKDIAFASRLKLKELNLAGTEIKDFRPLQRLTLQVLDLSGTGVEDKDLELLKDLPLRRLGMRDTPVTSLKPLENMALDSLDLSGSKAVYNFTPIAAMPLRWLRLDGTGMADLGILKRLPLEGLGVSGTRVTDLAPLKGMKLVFLDISRSGVRDLSPLADMPLHDLRAAGTGVSSLAPLQGMLLTVVDISHTKVTDLSPLGGMALERFFGNGLTPLTWRPLMRMPLTELSFDRKNSDEEQMLIRSLKQLRRINGKDL